MLVMLLVKPTNAGFEATFRVVAYSGAIQLVTWVSAIPILGALIVLVAAIYSLYISASGIRELHSTTQQRAAAVVAIPILVAIMLSFVFAFVIAVLSKGEYDPSPVSEPSWIIIAATFSR